MDEDSNSADEITDRIDLPAEFLDELWMELSSGVASLDSLRRDIRKLTPKARFSVFTRIRIRFKDFEFAFAGAGDVIERHLDALKDEIERRQAAGL